MCDKTKVLEPLYHVVGGAFLFLICLDNTIREYGVRLSHTRWR